MGSPQQGLHSAWAWSPLATGLGAHTPRTFLHRADQRPGARGSPAKPSGAGSPFRDEAIPLGGFPGSAARAHGHLPLPRLTSHHKGL